jgi:hypothetical protein
MRQTAHAGRCWTRVTAHSAMLQSGRIQALRYGDHSFTLLTGCVIAHFVYIVCPKFCSNMFLMPFTRASSSLSALNLPLGAIMRTPILGFPLLHALHWAFC